MTKPLTVPCTYELARREFPDYAGELFPASIPAGAVESSWHNDTCPSVSLDHGDSLRVRIWFEMETRESREFPDVARYTVSFEYMEAGIDHITVLETEDWAEVLAWFDVSDFADAIARPIKNHADLYRFIRAVIWHDCMWHFEDSPDSICWGDSCPVKPEHYAALSARVREAYALKGWTPYVCPIGMALDMEGRPADD